VVRCTFSPARAWRPAVVARLARTLGSANTTILMPQYEVSTDAARLDVKAIHAFLAATYWSPGIPLSTVERAVRNSVCVGAYTDVRQVGFARMVTDKATFAYLADVYVLEEHRRNGLSKRMMEALLQLQELQGLRRVLLATRDAHALYERFGFKALATPARFMELHNQNAYAPAAPSAA
jgi:GNAT superfamily N-acetyltransferase